MNCSERKPWLLLLLLWCTSVFSQTLSLESAIEQALAHNPELLQYQQKVRAVAARFWEGISPQNPEIFREYERLPDGDWSFKNYEVRKTGFAQGFDFPLAYFFKGQFHLADKSHAQAGLMQHRHELTAEVKKAFFQLLVLEKQTALYNEIAKITEENFQKARIRVLAGETSPYDTLKMKVDLVEAENQVVSIRNDREIARGTLNVLMGRDVNQALELSGELAYQPYALDVEILHAQAQANHPELSMANAAVTQKSALRSLAWSELLPSIHIKYFKMDIPRESTRNAWGGEVGLTVPLWLLFRGQGAIRASSFEFNAAQYQRQAILRKIRLHIEEALSRLIVAQKQVSNYQENTLREVEELVRIATRSYEEGEMGYLEVADALRTMNRINAGYYEALYQYLAAQADLEVAVGSTLK